MLSPLKNLLCRHDFYWSERHRSDRCRHCGKTRVVEETQHTPVADTVAPTATGQTLIPQPDRAAFILDAPDSGAAGDSAFFDIPPADPVPPSSDVPVRRPASDKVLRAQAIERRENLLVLLDRIAEGGPPSRRDSLDAVLAVIEDAHSADPVLYGADAAGHFARLHEARGGLIF